MPPRPTRTVSIASLRRLVEGLLTAAGCAPDVAAAAADVFVEAELQGNWIQGLQYVHAQVKNLRLGRIDPKGRPRIAREGPAFAHVLGDRGLGQLAGNFAADLACRKARSAGAAAVGVTDSSDIFMLSYYAERMTRAGMVGAVTINSPPTVHAWGGVERVLGTNPFAVGFPTAGAHPFLLDVATSAELSARVRIAAHYGERLARGAAVGADGRPTTDPAAALAGALSPLGGAKGYGLGLMVAFLSGCLLGNAVGKAQAAWHGDASGRAGRKGHLYIAVDADAFAGATACRRAASAYLAEVTASRARPGGDRIRFPGERAFQARARARAGGSVAIDGRVWETTAALAAELGVPMPG